MGPLPSNRGLLMCAYRRHMETKVSRRCQSSGATHSLLFKTESHTG